MTPHGGNYNPTIAQPGYNGCYEQTELTPCADHGPVETVHLSMDTILELVLDLDKETKSYVEKLASWVEKQEDYRTVMQSYLHSCEKRPSESHENGRHDKHLVKLIRTITRFVYRLDSVYCYATRYNQVVFIRQSPFDCRAVPATQDTLLFWDLKGESHRPSRRSSRVQEHYTRKSEHQPSNRDTPRDLKRPIGTISDGNMAAEPGTKRVRTSHTSDILSPPIAHADNITVETMEHRSTIAHIAGKALKNLPKAKYRSDCVSLVVSLDSLELLYYDGCNMVSGLLNIREDPATFLAMMISLLRLTPDERSMPPIVEDRLSANSAVWQASGMYPGDMFRGVELTMPYKGKEVAVTLGKTLRAHSESQTAFLVGGPYVVEASCKEIENAELVLKINFPKITRQSEVDILDAIIGSASEDSEWVHVHLPNKFSSLDVSALDDGLASRLYIFFQDENIQFKGDKYTFSYEKRVMRLILWEKLIPIHRLREPRDYAQVFFDVLQIHRWVHDVPKILHRDLSQANIMVRRDSKGRYRGVLNDWDLSSFLNDTARLKLRAGTLPFMSHELHDLEPDKLPMHRYRHDLESLFFVMVLLFCRNSLNSDARSEGPLHPVHVASLKLWLSKEEATLSCAKWVFLIQRCTSLPLSGFHSFKDWIQGLHRLFFRGALSRMQRHINGEDDPPELYMNNITYDAFFAVMATYNDTSTTEGLLQSYLPSD